MRPYPLILPFASRTGPSFSPWEKVDSTAPAELGAHGQSPGRADFGDCRGSIKSHPPLNTKIGVIRTRANRASADKNAAQSKPPIGAEMAYTQSAGLFANFGAASFVISVSKLLRATADGFRGIETLECF